MASSRQVGAQVTASTTLAASGRAIQESARMCGASKFRRVVESMRMRCPIFLPAIVDPIGDEAIVRAKTVALSALRALPATERADRFVMLHLRARHVSKAAILTGRI